MKYLISPFKAKYENKYTWIKKGVEEKWVRFWFAGGADDISFISQRFGANNIPLYKNLGMKGHNGTDWAIPNGTCLYAVHDATVTTADPTSGGYGSRVILQWEQDGKTAEYIYGHLDRPLVHIGQKVGAGELIALSDNSGRSTGPHLHSGLRFRDNGSVLDYDNGYFGYVDEHDFYYEVNPPNTTELHDLWVYFKDSGKWPWRKSNWLEAQKLLGISGHTRSQYYRYLLKH